MATTVTDPDPTADPDWPTLMLNGYWLTTWPADSDTPPLMPDEDGDLQPVTHADGDGDFVLSDGNYGNPGCDECGLDDAVVKIGSTYLCAIGWGERLAAARKVRAQDIARRAHNDAAVPAGIAAMRAADWTPSYSSWRHGGWYVDNIRYPAGGVGCVSNNYPDRKWRIVCDTRPAAPTYRNRDAAARAERDLILATIDAGLTSADSAQQQRP